MKPFIAITAGEPAGIGPEVTVKALKDPRVRRLCRTVVIGCSRSLRRCGWTPELSDIIDTTPVSSFADYPKQQPSAEGGIASFNAVMAGVRLAMHGGADALVTAPISKESWVLANMPYPAHTELLRDCTCSPDAAMLFTSGRINCALLTEHYPLARVSENITKEKIIQRVKSFSLALKFTGIKNPKIALCSLNPHNGDGGAIGTEEQETFIPAVKSLSRKGLGVDGPFPADAAWQTHSKGQWDGIVCAYHDQALIGLKLAAKEPVVHWTWGLPFVRTSPAHGTAFDIAGKNRANPQSMIAAVLFAAKHCRKLK